MLYRRGFYKTLRLSLFSTVNDARYKYVCNGILTLSVLEVFTLSTDSSRFKNLEVVAKNLIKLERLTFGLAIDDYILPFICHSKRLKSIKINGGIEDYTVDLFTLNEKRKKLEGACQFTCTQFRNYEM